MLIFSDNIFSFVSLYNNLSFFYQLLIAYISYVLISIILHKLPQINFLKIIFNFLINLFKYTLSPDYSIALYLKKSLNEKNQKELATKKKLKRTTCIYISSSLYENLEEKKISIIKWNIYNLIFTIFLFLLCYFFSEEITYFNIFFLYFFFCRCISRSLEIIIAFFKDVLDTSIQNPLLTPKLRVGLALNSLLETIINFAIFNFFKQSTKSSPYKNLFMTLESIGNENYCPFLIKSINNEGSYSLITSFIDSFGMSTSTAASLTSLMSILQIITTLTIILFAFAGYLNSENFSIKKSKKK